MALLLELVKKFPTAHLLVVGDLMIDRFIWGDVERISPEAPVPVLRVTAESIRLGGAANVIHNIRSLGGQVTACGIIGADAAGKRMQQELKRIGALTAGVVVDRQHQTIQKTRVIARPRKASGRVTLTLCQDDATAGEHLFSRRDGALFKRAWRAGWGSSL